MTQDELRRRWEAKHGRPSYAAPATKGATMPATGNPSFLTPEQQAQVADVTLDRHVVQPPCCEAAEAAGQSWDRKCAKHKGSAAQRAEDRRWERKAAAVMAAQTLGRGDPVPVVGYDEAAQRDSYSPPPLVERVYVV